MKTLLEEAQDVIAKEKSREKRILKNKLSEPTARNIVKRFIESLDKFPIAIELISTARKVSHDTFLTAIYTVDYYELNIGSKFANLMQYEVPASRDGGAIIETMYCAWAIKFTNIFGHDIYFIPYSDPKKGFACTVIDPNLDEEDEGKDFFNHDINKHFAVGIIANHLREAKQGNQKNGS